MRPGRQSQSPARGQDAPDAGHDAEYQRAGDDPGASVESHERQHPKGVADGGHVRQATNDPLEGVVQRRNAVHEYAAADKEHGCSADH